MKTIMKSLGFGLAVLLSAAFGGWLSHSSPIWADLAIVLAMAGLLVVVYWPRNT